MISLVRPNDNSARNVRVSTTTTTTADASAAATAQAAASSATAATGRYRKLLPSKQDRMTEQEFRQTLDGYEQIEARDLLGVRGGRMRYVIETADGKRLYRLGGLISKVDPALRYVCLFNPYANNARWSVQLAKPGQRVRLYYMALPTSDEAAMMRNLLQKMENGDVTLRKRV
jgi:hypothetical protein